MLNYLTFPNNHILTLIRIQFQFCIAEPTLIRGQNIIKHALTEGHTEYKIRNGIICVETLLYSQFFQIILLKAACNRKKSKGTRTDPCGTPVLTLTSPERHPFMITCCER